MALLRLIAFTFARATYVLIVTATELVVVGSKFVLWAAVRCAFEVSAAAHAFEATSLALVVVRYIADARLWRRSV